MTRSRRDSQCAYHHINLLITDWIIWVTHDQVITVIVGDGRKTMVMRGLETQKRGLSALRVGAGNILGRLYPVYLRAISCG